jgi:hypothetical protein
MEKKITVRAIPAGHHQVRWCAQRPWSREAVTVRVVDNAKPASVMTEVPFGHLPHYLYQHEEISPAELAELLADPHIVVEEMGSKLERLQAELAKVNAELGGKAEMLQAEIARASAELLAVA